jgi:hypothetical protein
MLKVVFTLIRHASGSTMLMPKPIAVKPHTASGIDTDAQYLAKKSGLCMQLTDNACKSNMNTRLIWKSQSSSLGHEKENVSKTAIVCMKKAAIPHVETSTNAACTRCAPEFVMPL